MPSSDFPAETAQISAVHCPTIILSWQDNLCVSLQRNYLPASHHSVLHGTPLFLDEGLKLFLYHIADPASLDRRTWNENFKLSFSQFRLIWLTHNPKKKLPWPSQQLTITPVTCVSTCRKPTVFWIKSFTWSSSSFFHASALAESMRLTDVVTSWMPLSPRQICWRNRLVDSSGIAKTTGICMVEATNLVDVWATKFKNMCSSKGKLQSQERKSKTMLQYTNPETVHRQSKRDANRLVVPKCPGSPPSFRCAAG